MIKIFITLIVVPVLLVSAGTHKSAAADTCYNIVQQDTFYFLLSNNSLKLLSNGNSSSFILWDSIPGQFTRLTTFQINSNYLLLKNNDSIFLYKKDIINGRLLFKNKDIDKFHFTLIFPFNKDFVVVTGSVMNIIGCNDDSVFTKTENIAAYNKHSIDYPYFVERTNIYKYLEGFGYYLAYSMPLESNIMTAFTTHNGKVIFRVYHSYDPQYPPDLCELEGRYLQGPDFPFYLNIHWWGVNYPNTWSGDLTATDKYLNFNGHIYAYNQNLVLNVTSYQEKIFITDKYIFKLGADAAYSTSTSSPPVFLPLTYSSLTGIDEISENIPDFALNQNFPNPFNSETIISYYVPKKEFVKIAIYDALGRMVKTLVSENKEKGDYSLHFKSEGLASGLYFYSLITSTGAITKKMILLK